MLVPGWQDLVGTVVEMVGENSGWVQTFLFLLDYCQKNNSFPKDESGTYFSQGFHFIT